MKKTNKFLSVILVLVTLFSVISVSSVTASATKCYYKLSDDGYYMDIYFDPYNITVPSSVQEIFIHDAKLTDELDLDNGKIHNITFDNCIIDMTEMGSFENLYTVRILNSYLDDLMFLSDNELLDYLYLDCCFISSLNGVQFLDNLKYFYTYNVGIESIEELKFCENLQELTLFATCVTDLTPIENMNLETLEVSNTMSILDLSPVMTLDKLDYFYSDNCEMAYTTELCDFIEDNDIYNDMSDDWQEIQQSVHELADTLFTDDMSDEEIIEATVKYVIDIMEYDYGIYGDDTLSYTYNESALSYALKGEGVCRNYSALVTVLLQEMDILVYEIRSYDHIWNIILLDDEWYWLDPTWIDDLVWEDALESEYYMNNEYDFVDHEENTVPASMYNPDYVPDLIFAICQPSMTTIRYKDGIILHTTLEDEYDDSYYVSWSWDYDNFLVEYNDDGTITIISDSNGYSIFTATLYDMDGNVIDTDRIEIRSKAGFFEKIGGFFRGIFGTTKTYEY